MQPWLVEPVGPFQLVRLSHTGIEYLALLGALGLLTGLALATTSEGRG